jgi:hypothetical protein
MDYEMEYNSSRELLIMPEYGRNIQLMVQHAKTIENDEERQAFVEKVVELMMQMHPQNRNLEDYRDKMWKHVFRIAEHDLQITPPEGIDVSPSDMRHDADPVEYPQSKAKYRHYGSSVQKMVEKAIAMEDEDKRQAFAGVIAAYMKLAYRTWNKEHYVSDEVIKADLERLSEGVLKIDENTSIENLTGSNNNNRRRSGGSKRSGGDRSGGRGRSKSYRRKKN